MSEDPLRNGEASSITADTIGIFVVTAVVMLSRMYRCRVPCAARSAARDVSDGGSILDRLVAVGERNGLTHRARGRVDYRLGLGHARVYVPAEVTLLLLGELHRLLTLDVFLVELRWQS